MRLALRGAFGKPADDRHPAEAAARDQILLDMQRHPEFRVSPRCEFKRGRENADDADALVVKLNRTAQDMRVAAETADPGAIAEDGDFWSRRDVLTGGKITPKERLDAKGREEIHGSLGGK